MLVWKRIGDANEHVTAVNDWTEWVGPVMRRDNSLIIAGLPMILLTEQLNLDIPWNRSSKWNAKITWSINKIEPHYFPHKNFRWWIFRDSEITLSEVWGWKFHLSSLVLIYIFFCFLRNKVVRSIALLELSFGIAFKEGGRARTN